MSHPWLHIPLADYESHMSMESVAQAQLLSSVLKQVVDNYRPRSLAVFGAAGGNGLDLIDPAITERVVALDFNPGYTALCAERLQMRFTRFESVLHDLNSGPPRIEPVDHIFAGLLLEYLDCEQFFDYLPALLTGTSMISVVVQLPSKFVPEVTPSPFVSLKQLESVFHFVAPSDLTNALNRRGFALRDQRQIDLPSRKSFHFATFQKHP